MSLKSATTALALFAIATGTLYGADTYSGKLESISADGISINQLDLTSSLEREANTYQINFAQRRYSIDYEPARFDLNGQALTRDENFSSLSLNAIQQRSEAISLLGGLGLTRGFTNYRSLWLAEYFRQQFSNLEGVPGEELYTDATPKSFSANAGARWNYIPNNASAQLLLSYTRDHVSPGYEIDFDGLARGQTQISTANVGLTLENILNKRLRSRVQLTASKTSDRNTRLSAAVRLNAALGDKLIWRNTLAAAEEGDAFDSWTLQTAFEYPLSDKISLYAEGRKYFDSGEIEDAFLFTTAAPSQESKTYQLGLRYTGTEWNARLSLGRTEADYAPTNLNTDFFQNLYRDRDWTIAQLAVSKTF